MKKLKWYDFIALILMIVGTINLGLSALGFNFFEKLSLLLFPLYFITRAYFMTLINIIIGISGIYGILLFIKLKKSTV